MMKKKLLFTALAAGMLGLLALALLARWPSPISDRETPLAQPATPEAPVSAHASQTASQPPAAPRIDANLPPAARELAALMASPVSLRDRGSTRKFQLSTTEVSLRGSDGAQKIVSLPSSDSPETFAAALEKLHTEEGVEPELVLYPVGFPQNEFTRSIATRQVVITAPSRAEADALAAGQGLVFVIAPVFAPNSFVYEAPTSAKALSVQADQSTALEATPLLASRAAKKTMPNDPYIQLQWHLKYQRQQGAVQGTDINVEKVWNYPSTSPSDSIRGRGVVIGIVDDGLEWNHPDLRPNVIPGLQWDWNGNDNDPTPFPLDSHGTACGGVAAARGNNRLGVSGVAPEANLAGLRLIAGPNTDLDEAEAMTWKMGEVHILSNSWGPPDVGFILGAPGDLTLAALKAAADFGRDSKGTILTWAGGNGLANDDNSNYDGYANSIYTIAVAAMDSDGVQSWYSEPGANIVVTAPSSGGPLGIMTTDNKGQSGYNYGTFPPAPGLPPNNDFLGSGDVTKFFGGTSSATPAVSGVIALMLEKNPNLGWRDVQEILIDSAAQVDAADPDWITNADGFSFNHKYGAGLVDAAAAVALSGNWTNLIPQTTSSVSLGLATPQPILPGQTINRTFSIPASLRAEHATLLLSIPGIFKGDLQIDLTSPAGTNSVLCEPHFDQFNPLDNWTFMTVRNWGENSTGLWKLTITNTGSDTGSLTAATLTVFGTPTANPPNPLPVVNLQASTDRAFVGTQVTLTANATDKNGNGTAGRIAKVEFFSNNGSGPVFIGNSTANSTANFTANFTATVPGNLTFTATATDSGDASSNSTAVSATSSPVRMRIDPRPLAAWDFDTATQSDIPLATAIQSVRQYTANFGSNSTKILLDGTLGSSLWSVSNGEIWTDTGTTENFLADSNRFGSNTALVLRGGKNLASNNKTLVFQVDMTNARRLEISYAAAATAGGFTTHEWDYWDDRAQTWKRINRDDGSPTIAVPFGFTEIVLDQVAGSGFNGRPDALVRLRVSGATAVSGTNLLDNIRFNATVAP